MKRLLAPLACAAVAALAAAACSPQPPAQVAQQNLASSEAAKPAMKAPPTDLEKLAERLVTQSAGVKEGEVVHVSGGPENIELLEDIAVQVRKVGAFPLVTVNTDRMAKRMYTDVPEKYDSQTNQRDLKLADVVNVEITLGRETAEGLFADADPKRMAARAKAVEPVVEAYLKRGVRTVEVDNGLYPTDWLPQAY